MRQRVMRPRIVVPQPHRPARGGFGLFQQVAFLVSERQHPVGIGDVIGPRKGACGDPQHRGKITDVERVVLAQFQHHHVARMAADGFLAQGNQFGDLAVVKQARGVHGRLLAGRGIGRGRFGGLQIGRGQLRGNGGFQQHVQDRGIGVDQRTVRCCLGGLQHIGRLGLKADEPMHKVVDALQGGIIGTGDGQAIKVGHLRHSGPSSRATDRPVQPAPDRRPVQWRATGKRRRHGR